jgi:hypothetical protein
MNAVIAGLDRPIIDDGDVAVAPGRVDAVDPGGERPAIVDCNVAVKTEGGYCVGAGIDGAFIDGGDIAS